MLYLFSLNVGINYFEGGIAFNRNVPMRVVQQVQQDFFLVIVVALVLYNRRRDVPVKKPRPEDDIRENIISYKDEGRGLDDMMAFNRSTFKAPGGVTEANITCKSVNLRF